ncbi:hypothetical protein IQ273_02425 [Nodosilinea sp. LEGE 07298]|uniref:hypothetical protein n=1 Tax=Nodosilinea sp. LEGE 07298 TaxID=2777970 RepID=UPI0018804AF5|nr:hypothetical protein [Nodosilinea sp. LEGE 07298]MBE9108278.1 hypothetical protein [Nodosilinea sp. LEGE 07298]
MPDGQQGRLPEEGIRGVLMREQAQALHAALVTTPEICQRLGLGLDEVMALLLPERQKDAPRAKHPVGRPSWTIEKEEGMRLLNRLVGARRRRLPLWTLPQLVGELREILPHPPSEDTVRRVLDRLGLTFTKQAEGLCAPGRSLLQRRESRRGRDLLYVVTHRTTRQLGLTSLPLATVVVGLSPGNRVVFAVRMQSRVSARFIREFLDGLSALHRNRRVLGMMVGGNGCSFGEVKSYALGACIAEATPGLTQIRYL